MVRGGTKGTVGGEEDEEEMGCGELSLMEVAKCRRTPAEPGGSEKEGGAQESGEERER
jgi:hypothetical protein